MDNRKEGDLGWEPEIPFEVPYNYEAMDWTTDFAVFFRFDTGDFLLLNRKTKQLIPRTFDDVSDAFAFALGNI